MGQLAHVIKEKGRLEKAERKRRESELRDIRKQTMYRSKMYNNMREIRMLLSDDQVEAVTVQVDQKDMTEFMREVYGDEMSEYSVSVDGNTAVIKRRMLEL